MNIAAYRRAMGAGVAFVVLFVAGNALSLADSPDPDSAATPAAAARTYVEYLSNGGHRTALVLGAYLLVVAGLAFVWFTLGLRERLGSDSSQGRLVGSFGVVGAVALAAAGMCMAGTAGSVAVGGEPMVGSGDAIRVVLDLAFPFVFVVFALAGAAVIGIVTAAALRGRGWPRWLGWLGVLAVVGSLAGVMLVPYVVPVAWFLAIAVTGVSASVALPDQRADGDAAGVAASVQRTVTT